jgi:predicted amidophosphoribosyltransferase
MRARSAGRANFRRPVILIDDIVTTGASLDEAARALTASHWRVIGAAVVARVGLRARQKGKNGAVPWG